MRIPLFSNAKPSLKLTITFLFSLTGLLVFFLLGSIIIYACYGYEGLQAIQHQNPTESKSIAIIKILQICQTIGLFIIPAFFLAYLFSDQPFRYLGFRKTNSNTILSSLLVMIIAFPAINLLGSLNMLIDLPEWMDSMEKNAAELTKGFMNAHGVMGISLNVFMIAILPALGEELVFRGIIQRIFVDWTKKAFWGIFISAAIFSMLHLQFQGFIPRLALGILFGYLYYWSGSLWIPIITHFTNNLIAIIGYTLMNRGTLPPETETIGGVSEMWPLGIASVLAVIGLMWVIKREKVTG